MRTFYIFKLNNKFKNIAKKNPESIYTLFSSIYNTNYHNINAAFNLFGDMCIPINSEFLNNYIYNVMEELDGYTKFKNIHLYNNYFSDETSKLEINNTYLLIKSNKKENIFYEKLFKFDGLFLCNFKNNFYTYLK